MRRKIYVNYGKFTHLAVFIAIKSYYWKDYFIEISLYAGLKFKWSIGHNKQPKYTLTTHTTGGCQLRNCSEICETLLWPKHPKYTLTTYYSLREQLSTSKLLWNMSDIPGGTSFISTKLWYLKQSCVVHQVVYS